MEEKQNDPSLSAAPLTPKGEEKKEVETASTLPSVSNETKEAKEGSMPKPEDPIQSMQGFLERFRHTAYDLFKAFNEKVGFYAEEITNNYLNYLKVFGVALLSLALLQTLLHILSTAIIVPLFAPFSSTEKTCSAAEGFIDPARAISVRALKEYLKTAKEQGLDEISFGDLFSRAQPTSIWTIRNIGKIFTLAFWKSFIASLEMNLFRNFLYWGAVVTTVLTSIWKALDFLQPLFNLWTTLNVDVLINENKQREEREKQHLNREFQQTCIVGWNIFKRFTDVVTGKERLSLMMPTETSFDLKEFLKYDPILYEILEANIKSDTIDMSDPLNFMVILDNPKDQGYLVQCISNRVSETVKSSQFPAFAHRKKADPDVYEEAIFVITCEKEPGVPTRHTRVWLIFPSELQMLRNYTEEQVMDPNGDFHYVKPHWNIRVKNLRLWALAEFDEKGNRRKNSYQSGTILLPLG